jgi:PAS domain S-box-containing protein
MNVFEIVERVIQEFPVLLIGLNENAEVVRWNTEAEQSLLQTQSSMQGKVLAMADWFDQPEADEIIRDLLTKEGDHEIGMMLSHLNAKDELIHFRFLFRKRTDTLPEDVKLWLIGVDMTNEVNLQERYQLAELRFRMISRATNDAVWDWNMETDELWWGEGIREQFGYPEAGRETAFSWWENRVHPEDRERVVNSLRDAAKRGAELWTAEYRFERKDGSYAHIYDRGWAVENNQGKAIRMIGGMLDITERKIHETNLLIRNQQLTEFSFFHSHKVRAPLARLMSCVDLMLSDEHLPAEFRDLTTTIRDSAEELDRMVRDINRILGSGKGV